MSKKSKKSQITGYRYFFDFLMGICRASVDSLVAIRVSDLPLWSGDQGGTGTFHVDKKDMFGGDTGEGGIVGDVSFMVGAFDQIIPSKIKDSIAGGPNNSSEGNWTFDDGVGTSDEGATSEAANDISEFRGVTTLFYSGQIASNNPYPKPWKVRTRRALQGWGPEGCWYPEKAIINYAPQLGSGSAGMWDASKNSPTLTSGQGYDGQTYNVSVAGNTDLDGINWWNTGEMASFNGNTSKWQKVTSGETIIRAMNPAHILYQCITDRSWGRGMWRTELDNDAWVYAANYLYNESFGLCIRWSKDGDINDFIQTIIDHIGAALYIDRGTGLMVLRLIRYDYDYAKLPVFDYSSGLISVDTQETGATLVLANEIVIKWHDPIRDQDRQTRVHNLASMQSLGYAISATREFVGIPDPDLAQRVALRELQVGSAGAKRLKVRFDRRAWRIQPGMVMRIKAPDKGIQDMVVRVATYDDGTMLDGTITMDVLQDVFGMPTTVYTNPVAAPPTNTSPGAPPVAYEIVQEASYLDMFRALQPADFQAVSDTEGGVIAMAARPNSVSQYFALMATPGGGTTEREIGTYVSTAVLSRPMGYYDVNIYIGNGFDLNALDVGMTGVLGGNELVKVTSITPSAGLIAVDRGGGDTVPVNHAAKEFVIFDDAINGAYTTAYEAGEVVTAQLQNVTSTSQSDLNQAQTHTVTIVARHFMPFVMGDLRLNGQPALSDIPLGATGGPTGGAAFTWASRNRIVQADQFVAHGDGPVVAEAGTTYTVEVHDGNTDALIRTHSGLTTTSYTYNDAEKASGAPDPVSLTFVFYTVRDGIRSLNFYRVPIYYVSQGEGVGKAAGLGTAAAVAEVFVTGTGNAAGAAAGVSNAEGVALGIATAVGFAPGLGSVIWGLTGSAGGVGTAQAVGTVFGVTTSTGTAGATGAASGVSATTGVLALRGQATGRGAALGAGAYSVAATGAAAGTGAATASGLTPGVTTATGTAQGNGAATTTPVELPVLDGFGTSKATGTNTISATVTTARTNNIIVFAVYAESDDSSAAAPTFTVSGGGLGWTRRATRSLRAAGYNTPGTLDVWIARATGVLTGVTVTATSSITFDAAGIIWFGVHGVANLTTPFDPHPSLPVLNAYDDGTHLTPTGFFSTSKGRGGDIIFTVIASQQPDLDESNPAIGAQGQTTIATIQTSGDTFWASMTALYRHDNTVNHHQPFGITNTVNNWIDVIDAFTAEAGYAGSALGRGTANGVGVSIALTSADGAASGVGSAAAVGSYFRTGTGSATGTGAANAGGTIVGTITPATGSAMGTGAANAAGGTVVAITSSGDGSASGIGTANGIASFDRTFMIVGVGVVM